MIPRWMLCVAAILGQCSWGCQQSPLTPADQALLGGETEEQTNCVVQNRGDAGAMDACRARVRHLFDAIWAAKLGDGGAQ